MKVIWLCNFPLPEIAKKLDMKETVNEGWIQGLSNGMKLRDDVEIIYLFPQTKEKKTLNGNLNGIRYYGFYRKFSTPSQYDADLVNVFVDILNEVKPNVIHIMGTEFAHSYAMAEASEKCDVLQKTVVSIQGMPSVYAQHYLSGIPEKICNRRRIKDIVYHSSLTRQKKVMLERGFNEERVLKKVPNVFGRTEWDKACTCFINPERFYYHGGEILRNDFYTGEWDIRNIEKHSVFISQATYPIKGFHYALDAFGILKRKYDDLKIYVSGRNIFGGPVWKMSSYEKYVNDIIDKLNLRNNIVFTGPLKANEMKTRYLTSHVFVSPSTIENSPNSVGEAMILGVPTISSDVGGVKDMLAHGEEGFVYPMDEPYMLAYYIDRVFSNDSISLKLSECARNHALKTHDSKIIVNEMMENYYMIMKNKPRESDAKI